MRVSSTPCASTKPSFLSVLPRPELVVFPYETKLPPPHSRSLATSLPGSAPREFLPCTAAGLLLPCSSGFYSWRIMCFGQFLEVGVTVHVGVLFTVVAGLNPFYAKVSMIDLK
ncbi:hypothetical protein SLEP1_g36627 [Rubroshorea leprosula]|uniref:Uncharacterized protein n=1 Tax=Rubroshorea leprosula TaxID=152421 RepID=A0AAV5KSI3_9ROSI|nr:hypothetical protein SLEP1_g36627 [Rubroshorea leprosula]